ncbi:hypothetical protein SAMN05444007_108238 [Cribrihabitans marinus]|uniref:Uncharacterized protein n=1 Tax=Cribrihabitans marinus TaxID=1227549 RepID=A0A1H7CPI1_9RHOB|nr:hypothetical protein [Cribrihabitans marinus]GGH36224.1 hypothetical protein GCM10010973_30070 [Cribrihabitans marinus]SEJ91366.1 hypothetical protein SAMN05444007_108238 [Cribrihabitans marinus]
MAKVRNSFERLAGEAAERLDAARQAGEQLALLADEPGRTPVEAGSGNVGRPKGALGKGSSQLRKWLAERGYRMPEDVLAEIAGLASGQDAMLTAMAKADQVLTWAYGGQGDKVAQPEQRISMFMQIYAAQLRAADALLPYGTPKASPDTVVQQSVTVNVPAAPAQARDVTPQSPRISGRMVPADVAHEIEQKQDVSTDGIERPTDENSDGDAK